MFVNVVSVLMGPPTGRAEATASRRASLWLQEHVPATLEDSAFLGLAAWQWVFLLGAFALGLILSLAIRLIVSVGIRRLIRQDGSVADRAAVRHAAKPFGLGAAALLWHACLPVSGLEGDTLAVLLSAVHLFGVVMLAWAAFRIADYIAMGLARRAARTESRLDDLLVPLARKTIKGGAVIVAIIASLHVLGLAVGPLLASVGLGGLAVAFAAKDTIENFFGSIAVIVDRPFEVGDSINVAGVSGEVLEVGFRSTRLRSPAGSDVTLPNAVLVRATVERVAPIRARPSVMTLRLDAAARPDDIAAACDDLREILASHPKLLPQEQRVRLIGMSEGGLEVQLQAIVDVDTRAQELDIREQVLLASLRALERRGLALAGDRPATGGGGASTGAGPC